MKIMNNDLVVRLNEIVILEEKLQKMKLIEKQIKEMKEDLKVSMQDNDLKKWETPNGTKITLVEDTPESEIEVKVLDRIKFYEDNKNIVNELRLLKEKVELLEEDYTVTKTEIKKGRKGYVRITLPKGE